MFLFSPMDVKVLFYSISYSSPHSPFPFASFLLRQRDDRLQTEQSQSRGYDPEPIVLVHIYGSPDCQDAVYEEQ